jgi:predicted phage terminase large subunit-like protein
LKKSLQIPTKIEVAQEWARRRLIRFTTHTKPGYIAGWFNTAIADALVQFYHDVIAGKQPRLMIFAPPRSGKSELFSRRFPAWALGKNPDLQIIASSYSADLSSRMNRDVQRIIDDPMYQAVFPDTRLNGKNVVTVAGNSLRNSEIFEVVGHSGAYRSAGVGGGITGMGADIAIIDDPIKDAKEARSETVRNSVQDWYTSTLYTRLSPKSGILLGMTRWHENDLAGWLLEEMAKGEGDKWQVISFPAIAEEDEEHRKAGDVLQPERYPLERMLKIKSAVGDRVWNALYQQRPSSADGDIFRPDNIPVIDAIPWQTGQWVRGWDLGASRDGDPTVGAKIGLMPDGRYLIADLVRMAGPPHEVEACLKNTADRDGKGSKQSIPQDPGQAGKSQVEYFTRILAGHRVASSPETGDKVTRAEPFAAQVNVGNVAMLRAPWNDALIAEMRAFPNGAHDDQVDALSRAFGELIKTVNGGGKLFGGAFD